MSWRQWIRTVEIEPAISAADPSIVAAQVEALLRTGCHVFHARLGDDPAELELLRSLSPVVHRYDGILDVRAVGANPVTAFASVAQAGGDSVTFQLEAVEDVAGAIESARALGLQAGVAFVDSTAPEEAVAHSGEADLFVCPGSDPGEQLRNLRRLARALPVDVPIQVAGGITHDSVRELFDAGAKLLVVGTAIFEREDLPRAYRRLVQALA